MTSLKRQFRTSMLIATLIAAASLLLWVDTGVKRMTRDYILTRLEHDADSVMTALSKGPEGHWSIKTARLGTVYDRVYSGYYYQVFNQGTDIRSRSMWDFSFTTVPENPAIETVNQAAGPKGQQLLIFSRRITKSGDDLNVWVAEDIQPLNAARHHYSLLAALALLTIMLALVAVQQWILGRGFIRLDSLRSAIRDLKSGHIANLSTDVPLEIAPLIDEINRLLARLEVKVSRSRNAMGNLAHEMKRPMDRLTRLSRALDPVVQAEIIETINELEHLVARELKRARIVGVATPGRQTRLDDDVPILIKALQQIYPGRNIHTDYSRDLILPHDRDDMLELLGNLLDNALKHGAGDVSLIVTEDHKGWTIVVADNGAGVPESDIPQVLKRGTRLDESMSTSGSGLGLAICADIVGEYGGEIHLNNRLPQGLEVSCRLFRDTAIGYM